MFIIRSHNKQQYSIFGPILVLKSLIITCYSLIHYHRSIISSLMVLLSKDLVVYPSCCDPRFEHEKMKIICNHGFFQNIAVIGYYTKLLKNNKTHTMINMRASQYLYIMILKGVECTKGAIMYLLVLIFLVHTLHCFAM